jgi:glyoxylase-like metal-dependent hydrolase (beta-lactamase superfamily II)
MTRPKVTVLKDGTIVREGGRVVDASSSISLVEEGDLKMVVDTGLGRDLEFLIESLKKAALSPEEVTDVVNTHLHVDHVGCNDLFENARFVAHELEEPPVGTLKIKGPLELTPGVRVVPTPGHTLGSVSVFVSGERNWAIAGDAVPSKGNYEKHVPPSMNFDPRIALESLDVIIGWADAVVPGHDKPFDVLRKKYDG